jgi:hypothetical protein
MLKFAFFIVLVIASRAYSEECHPIKSLRSLYGSEDFEWNTSKVVVGVIGSGVDYNHPGLARFLPARFALEKKLQKIETQPETQQLNACEYQLLQKKS